MTNLSCNNNEKLKDLSKVARLMENLMLLPSISVRSVLNFKSNSNLKWKQLLTPQVHVLMVNMRFNFLGYVSRMYVLSTCLMYETRSGYPTRNDSPVIKLGSFL